MGREIAELRRELERHLGDRHELSFHETAAPEDAGRLTRQALDAGAELIVSVGGDGTLYEVVNGYVQDGKIVRDAPLAILSRGTGGDTRRTLALPVDIPGFARMVAAGRTRRIDLGLVDLIGHDGAPRSRAFFNVADLGIGGDVVSRVNRSSKRLGGFLTFLACTVGSLLRYQPQAVDISFDGAPAERHSLVILAVANCRYFGGGMHVAPLADPSDGLFDVVIVDWPGRLKLLRNLPKIYSGTHLGLRVVRHRRASRISAHAPAGEVLVDLDGEQPGRLPVAFRMLPGAIPVCVP